MRAVAIEINWLLFLSVAPSHTGFKVSRDSERPMTSGEVEFNNKVKFDWNSTSHWSGELELRAHPIRHHFVSNSILSIIISTVLPTLNSCDYSQI